MDASSIATKPGFLAPAHAFSSPSSEVPPTTSDPWLRKSSVARNGEAVHRQIVDTWTWNALQQLVATAWSPFARSRKRSSELEQPWRWGKWSADGSAVNHAARCVDAQTPEARWPLSNFSSPIEELSAAANGQKHQQKQAQQSAPSLAEQNKPSQPPPTAAHQEQNSQRSTPSAQQNNPSQPNASHGKGKGGGEKKSDKKKDKGDNCS